MLKMTVNINGKFGNQINNLSRGGAIEAEMELKEHHLSDLDTLRELHDLHHTSRAECEARKAGKAIA